MAKKYIIALDQGTTSSRAIIYDKDAHPIGSKQKEFTQYYPHPGWVEHDAEELFKCQLKVLEGVLIDNEINKNEIAAIGITNQRETVVIWDKKTGKPKFKSNSTDQLAGYARQLYVYNKLLKHSGMTHLYDGSTPNYNIIQLHLISGQYKKFNIPQGLVEAQGKTVEKVLQWYWDVRNGVITNETVKNTFEEDEYLEFLTL